MVHCRGIFAPIGEQVGDGSDIAFVMKKVNEPAQAELGRGTLVSSNDCARPGRPALVCLIKGIAGLTVLEVGRLNETKLCVVQSLRYVFIGEIPINPNAHHSGSDSIDLELGHGLGSDAALREILYPGLQNEVAFNRAFGYRRISKINCFTPDTKFLGNVKSQVQGWCLSAIGQNNLEAWRFVLCDDHIGNGESANPSSLLVSECCLRVLGGFCQILLGFRETILGDFLLRDDGRSIVDFGLSPRGLHFINCSAGNVGLPEADTATKDAAEREYASKYHHPPINRKLSVSILFIALLGILLLLCKLIYSLGVENWNITFIMKYGLMAALIFGGQFVFYLILRIGLE